MLNTYYVVGADADRCVECHGALVMLLVAAKMDECGEAVNVFAEPPVTNVISAYSWMREWSDMDECIDGWTDDDTTR